jgi:hypothetical protein
MRTHVGHDDLIGVRVDDEICIVSDKYNLPFLLRCKEQFNQIVENGLGVQILLRLVNDERPVIGLVECQV